jgi:hypothetical protein
VSSSSRRPIVTITGGRDHVVTTAEFNRLWVVLDVLRKDLRGVRPVVRCGGARGVDTEVFVEIVAHSGEGYVTELWMPDWARFGRIGPDGAGFRRNRAMLTGSVADILLSRSTVTTRGQRADMLIAFRGNAGTAHCVRSAKSLNIPVETITP